MDKPEISSTERVAINGLAFDKVTAKGTCFEKETDEEIPCEAHIFFSADPVKGERKRQKIVICWRNDVENSTSFEQIEQSFRKL